MPQAIASLPATPTVAYQLMAVENDEGARRATQPNGEYRAGACRAFRLTKVNLTGLESHQHAGPKLSTYSSGRPTTVAAVHFAHLSRRLTIRTVSQTANAAQATPKIASISLMRGIVAGEARGREGPGAIRDCDGGCRPCLLTFRPAACILKWKPHSV